MRFDADVIVVGGGVMGSAAAWAATRQGLSVLLLERFEAGHTRGASHGATRNFNTAYATDDHLDLVLEARGLWDELQEASGRVLLDLVGLVNHGFDPSLRTTAEALRRRGIAHSFLHPAAAAERWAGMRFRTEVLLVPDAGRVRAADALAAFRDVATARGAQFRYSTAVRDVVTDAGTALVVTDAGEFRGRYGVVTVGAWSEKLLSARIGLPRLVVTQEQPAHFAPRAGEFSWPSFNHTPDPGEPGDAYWYSPVYGMLTPGEGVKAGWHGTGPVTDPDARTYRPDPVQLAALQRYAREWLPGVDADSAVPISCTYTSTDTADFVLARSGAWAVGAGFSGQGFKFAPAVGRTLLDVARGEPAPPRFSPALVAR
ncbi:FAD-dependent oxidoreductase [Kineococcus rhizosphaerae]|uniref:Sarcosine oxidase n=1 Tax=Kineococcus rhizosphaerae TaxID=559628 RepID=A0A2T0QXC4_9ACTN|nr:FAD-dependent oxidoreductase [Kineococcus rhizosphaerae]PRY10467.1 sarcosine oxidase [Kineococcus rhizosphaerae]